MRNRERKRIDEKSLKLEYFLFFSDVYIYYSLTYIDTLFITKYKSRIFYNTYI